MLHASLSDPGTYEALLSHPAWMKAIGWLRALPADIPNGRHKIIGEDMFASVMEYDTVPREAARFESHREHVDLQFAIAGTEGIDWCPRAELEPDGPFGDDVQFWLPPVTPVTTLESSPGRFSVFFPSDAHRPKVRIQSVHVRKLVIKVHVRLLA
jgi:YhcH/YjgK/YiaL family protein